MQLNWLTDPLRNWQKRYQKKLTHFESELDIKTVSLPSVAPWTKRLTQVILLGIAAGAGWSILARVDVVVTANGKLEPLSQSQVIQSRVGGTVTAVLVREGESVKQGQPLMQLDKTSLYNQMQEMMIQRERLVKEIAVLRIAQQGKPMDMLNRSRTPLSPELMNQVQTRLLLVAQITGDPSNLNPEQRQRFSLFQKQLRDRQSLAKLQESTISTQIGESEAKIAQAGYQLKAEQELMDRLKPLADRGGISRVNLVQREVNLSELKSQMMQNNLQKQQLRLGQIQSKVEQGKDINLIQQDLQRQLAELDSRFNTIIKDSQGQLIQVEGKLNQIKIDLKGQDLRAPADGVVFELGPKLPGAVAQPGQTLLQVVPNEALTARVQVANEDIANIRTEMPVDVRVNAYPFTEYGSLKGTVVKVANEAISVSQQNGGPTVFPVEVRLENQFLERNSKRHTLTPGMSMVALIKVRQRAPISYVTEEITKVFDGAKSVR